MEISQLIQSTYSICLSIGGMDTTLYNKTAAAIIAAQKNNNEQTNNNDGQGERSFINIGNVNGW